MRAFIIMIFCALICTASAQNIEVSYPGYTSYWNPITLIPDSVIWFIKPHAKAAGRCSKFHNSGDRKNMANDYKHSGYDIGHNCDASDENGNATDEYNSFDFVNTYPQLPKLNRITWLALENYCRQIGNCKIKVSWEGVKTYIGKDHIAVPLYCIKEIWHQGEYEKYVLPNQDSVVNHSFQYYKQVESR